MAIDYSTEPQFNHSTSGVYVDASDAVSGLYRFANFTRAAVKRAAQDYIKEVVPYMKKNAPWENRTGKAREQLSAEYFEQGVMSNNNQFSVGVRLSHGVPYGKYLEYNGLFTPSYKTRRRPILVPTLESDMSVSFLKKIQAQFAKIAKV